MTAQHAPSFAQVGAPPSPVTPASLLVPLEEPLLEPLLEPLEEPPLEPLLEPLEDPLLDPLEDPLLELLLLELSVAAASSSPEPVLPPPLLLLPPKLPVLLFDEHAASNPKTPPDAHTNLLIFSIDRSSSMVTSPRAQTEPIAAICLYLPRKDSRRSVSYPPRSCLFRSAVRANEWAAKGFGQSVPLMFATG
jgi:hypothetical protein